MPRGLFITFEGPEGSGKSRQSQALAAFLEAQGHQVVWTQEPGGTELGRQLRQALLARQEPLTAWSEAFLFLADRAQHVDRVIRPALEAGHIVLCDRYTDSTLAYQGYGRGLPVEELRRLNALATGGLTPDLTVLLDVDVEVGLARRARSREWNRLDAETLAFHQRVRQGYLALAQAEPQRWVILQAEAPFDEVQKRLRDIVLQRLARVG